MDFDDCGVMVFRDKVICSPVEQDQGDSRERPVQSLREVETVDATIGKLGTCEAVERYNVEDWNSSSYLEGTEEGADALKRMLFYMEEAQSATI